MRNNHARQIQDNIDKAMKFMRNNDESISSNIEKFKKMLRDLGDDIKVISSYETPSEIMHVSIASSAFKSEVLKTKFLECILEIVPESLYGEYFTTNRYTLQLLTPLRLSIKNRSLDMVNAVLDHAIFNKYINQNSEDAIDQIFRSYMYALRWYDQTGTFALFERSSSGLNPAEMKNRYQNQTEILKKLQSKCIEAMLIAREQGKGEISKKLIHVFLADGIGGEAFSMHGKRDLLSKQIQAMTEICKAGLVGEELDDAKKKGLVVEDQIILDLIDLRASFLQSNLPENRTNIARLQSSLEKLSECLGAAVLLDFLSVYGRGYKDVDQKIVSPGPVKFNLHEFACGIGKKHFSKCIKDFEEKLKIDVKNIDEARLRQVNLTPNTELVANPGLSSTNLSMYNSSNISSKLAIVVLCIYAMNSFVEETYNKLSQR